VSDLLDAAAASLGVPEGLVQRSAAARATANGTSTDDVLAAWAGGTATAPSAKMEPAGGAEEPAQPAAEPAEETPTAAVATLEPVAETALIPAPIPEPEPAEPVEPVPIGRRVRTAIRVGAWTGGGLGLVGFVMATAFWGTNATVIGEGPYTPSIIASVSGVLIGSALISILFGVVVAVLSRSATAWTSAGMELSTPASVTAWMGAGIGLVLGVVAGSLLTGLGTPIEGQEGVSQLPVLSTLAIMIIGGAILGGLTAALTQAVGIPIAKQAGEEDEIAEIKGRLSGAVSIPLAGLILLLLLVLPFAWALIQSAELSEFGAPIIAILTATGILAFASLAGSRPNMRISFGELMVAVVGIGTVIVVILVVLFSRAGPGGPSEPEAHGPGGTVTIHALPSIAFDANAWKVDEGDVTLDYVDDGNLAHTLTIEGMEDDILLRVNKTGDEDQGTISLPPGTYTLYCTITGHRQQGMEGTLTVEPAPGEPPAEP
jgi:plastocyanin